jgi:hypothetical protein
MQDAEMVLLAFRTSRIRFDSPIGLGTSGAGVDRMWYVEQVEDEGL